jgi:hypothetical protein
MIKMRWFLAGVVDSEADERWKSLHKHLGKDQELGKHLCLYLVACIFFWSYVIAFVSPYSHLLLTATM